MMDGIHISLQNQAKAVLTNPTELGSDENKLIEKIQSCPDYKKVFQELLKFTPQEEAVTIDHVTSAISFYYDKFSRYYSPFDEAVNNNGILAENEIRGFNLFMSKTQCATCHFVPQFNGVKPPYVGSEFEVLGVPEDTGFNRISDDKGRFNFNPAFETMNAFRTGSLRNSIHTAPYMHNGVFRTMEEVLDFYDSGGGAGKGLQMINQTLSEDSLHLTRDEKKCIIAFLNSLNEKIQFETPPEKLPLSRNKVLNGRKIGGEY
jgi:cytochrome c peroxidase